MPRTYSFQSIWYKPSRKDEQWQPWYDWFDLRRVGFEVHLKDNGETIFFKDLNEAITEELAKKFDDENFPDITAVSEDVQKRDKMRAISPTLFKDLAGITERDGSVEMHDYAYKNERGKLDRIVKDVFENNKSDFKSVEEIFDIFAKAAMSGKLLPVARLIKNIW